jgi:hypothetical protein
VTCDAGRVRSGRGRHLSENRQRGQFRRALTPWSVGVVGTFKQEVADSVTAKTPKKAATKKALAKAITSKTTAAKKATK